MDIPGEDGDRDALKGRGYKMGQLDKERWDSHAARAYDNGPRDSWRCSEAINRQGLHCEARVRREALFRTSLLRGPVAACGRSFRLGLAWKGQGLDLGVDLARHLNSPIPQRHRY